MAEAGDPAPEGVTLDTSVAHPARVYDYWLGGTDNFAADREAAEQVIAANPVVVPGPEQAGRGPGADGLAVHPGPGRSLGDRRARARVACAGQLPDRLGHGPRHRHRAGARG